jgi:signal transduction histidine kinase/iron only hydrogenase large subunit-like protein
VSAAATQPFVATVPERCRTCYTCVRECPAKAIRIVEGQASVIPDRCIACGHCVRVCRQGAKRVLESSGTVRELLAGPLPVVACLAPSFPAEFIDVPTDRLVGALRQLGFRHVVEVGFGADVVADRYRQLMKSDSEDRWIGSSCPAIVSFVERYEPEIVDRLAPVVSPMVAMARILRQHHEEPIEVVFVGPCVAKKVEAERSGGEVAAALTFAELRQLWADEGIDPAAAAPGRFDPPHPGLGALFAIHRGALQAAGLAESLLDERVVAACGRGQFAEALREFRRGTMETRLLEVLCCNGCIVGAGMTSQEPLYRRRARVSHYVRNRLRGGFDPAQWRGALEKSESLDLSPLFRPDDQRQPEPSNEQLRSILAEMGKTRPEDELDCGACGYDTCRAHAIAISKDLAESEMCLPYTIEELHRAVGDLAESHRRLATTQEALMQTEKLASMGQLAAGIAHEVNNPLGIVLMYAHLLLDELGEEAPLRSDVALIAEQADRCKKIVAGLLDFARQNKVLLQTVDAAELAERALRSVPVPAGITTAVVRELEDPQCELDADQVLQVLTNLLSNAVAAMPSGGSLTLRVRGDEEQVQLLVEDTGTGIGEEHLKKIFEPFFTTKKIGLGTGLGLAVAYGIVKMHRGDIAVHSNADPSRGPTGTTFTVSLPRRSGTE